MGRGAGLGGGGAEVAATEGSFFTPSFFVPASSAEAGRAAVPVAGRAVVEGSVRFAAAPVVAGLPGADGGLTVEDVGLPAVEGGLAVGAEGGLAGPGFCRDSAGAFLTRGFGTVVVEGNAFDVFEAVGAGLWGFANGFALGGPAFPLSGFFAGPGSVTTATSSLTRFAVASSFSLTCSSAVPRPKKQKDIQS